MIVPIDREESITEFAMFWNRRKINNFAELLQKRLTVVGFYMTNVVANLDEGV